MIPLLTVLLRTAGVGLIFLALAHIPISGRLKWREEGARMSPPNAAVFRVHTFFICVVLVIMGAPALIAPRIFLRPSEAGAWITWSYALFWGARLFFQWFVFPTSLWRGKRLETGVHILFTVLWTALTALFAACGLVQLGRLA